MAHLRAEFIVLSEYDKCFIANCMRIEVSSIEEKLCEPSINGNKQDIEIAISKFIEAIISQNEAGQSRDIYSTEDSKAEKFISQYSVELSEKFVTDEAKWTLDSLRHAFVGFAFNGLHQLYTRQQNEAWYPKIILVDVLEPNDIENLDEAFQIYRGCDKSELETGNFGQAWSTCDQVAREFAFTHYESQDWYKSENRVVLRACYRKEDVLFSSQTDFGEYEIAVKQECLQDVELHITT